MYAVLDMNLFFIACLYILPDYIGLLHVTTRDNIYIQGSLVFSIYTYMTRVSKTGK